ncbi:hypothetical protein [Actinomadura rugatobispora]|uniref:Uncharacterized protein n=1 Tax=Actinomadura rugatobispora TaxID=1994 RepID=A0ABW1A599_9ACTN|nr:hypothetical protein GCM10010200_049630 [Actinomadura rugatobispora]
MSFGEPGCPVCGSPVAEADAAGRCADPGCRWVLHTGWMPGPGDREGFERSLAGARMAYDLRAAARAGDGARRFVRGVLDEGLWTQARQEALRLGVPAHQGGAASDGVGGGTPWEEGDGEVGEWTRAYAALGNRRQGARPDGAFVHPAGPRPQPGGGHDATGQGAGGPGVADGPRAEGALTEALGEMNDMMAVIEVDPSGLSLLYVRTRDLDTADPWPFREHHPWRQFAPMLSDDPDELGFQVAGGLHRVDRAALNAALGGWLKELVARIRPDLPAVMVCTAPGWTVPEQAVGLLRRMRPTARSAASVVPVAEELPGAIARQPLRSPYALIVAEARPEGPVPVAVPLFPAGSVAGQEARATVTRGPGGIDQDIALAVVVGAGGGGRPAPGSHHEPVSIVSAGLPRGTTTVRAVLDGPGRVRWLEPADIGVEARTLEELYAQTRASAVASGYAELMCAVELGGPPERAAKRKDLVSGTLELVAEDLPDRARVAVYGYYEHSFQLGEEQAPVTDGVWITEPEAARAALAALPPAAGTWQADAAPLEDALAEIVQRIDEERSARNRAGPWPGMPGPGAHEPWPGMPGPGFGPPGAPGMPPVGVPRTLLVVAGRPPHPRRQGQDRRRELAQPCPRKHDWQAAYERLRRAGVRFVAVLDKSADTGDDIWRALGADHLAVVEDLGPRELAEALRLVPAGGPSLPFPLRGDHA